MVYRHGTKEPEALPVVKQVIGAILWFWCREHG